MMPRKEKDLRITDEQIAALDTRSRELGMLDSDHILENPIEYDYHAGVKTLDDLLEYMRVRYRETQSVWRRRVVENNGNVPDEHEENKIDSYCMGASSAYRSAYIHLKKIMEDTSN